MSRKGQPTNNPHGRPKLPPGEGANNLLTVRVSDALHERIQASAAARGQGVSTYTRDLLIGLQLLGEDPLGVLRGMVEDPSAERTKIEPRSTPTVAPAPPRRRGKRA
jgi:hypothetical protein